jgi:hypothetical protein
MELSLQEALFPVHREVHPLSNQGDSEFLRPEDGGDIFLRNVGSYKEADGVLKSQKPTPYNIVRASNIQIWYNLLRKSLPQQD